MSPWPVASRRGADREPAAPLDAGGFVPRRALPLVERAPTREWQEACGEGRAAGSPLPEPARRYKTVVPVCYFGDSMDKPTPRPRAGAGAAAEDRAPLEVGAERLIVVSVKPCRDDVVRVEQDEGRLDECWSLPGGGSGFKADWSFVQQWRLRGPGGASGSSTKGTGGHDGGPRQCATARREAGAATGLGAAAPASQQHQLAGRQLGLPQRRSAECAGNSSSDENRSSGHASMSDTGGHTSGSSPPHRQQPAPQPHQQAAADGLERADEAPADERLTAGVTAQRSARTRSAQSRVRHRAAPAKAPWSGSGLEDIKLALRQLSLRSHASTSTRSSQSGSESSGPAARRLLRHSSLETVNSSATSADEFVWVDSQQRLAELQQPPWTQQDVLRVLQAGRAAQHMDRVSMEAVPRLSYLLQRALVRVGREAQRLARPLGLCGRREVLGALRIVLCPALADSCAKACLRAAAMFAVSGEQPRQSKGARAGLQMPVGRFLRWTTDARLGRMVHEHAAVCLAAALENLLEELLMRCLPDEPCAALTAAALERAVAGSAELWGLLQPCAHLCAGRLASGALSPSPAPAASSAEAALLTTCVGSSRELHELLARLGRAPPLTARAVDALFYFMRCSQLEHGGRGAPVQRLAHERAYALLPPLGEWLRVAGAHAEYRQAQALDQDDVAQAARLLLPGVDCPARALCSEGVAIVPGPPGDADYARRLGLEVAFKLLASGRPELVPQALPLLPGGKLDALNEQGLTALMLASAAGDEAAVATLLDAGARPDAETPAPAAQPQAFAAETQHWTALTFAALLGHCGVARLLLGRGAAVEGGARAGEDRPTLTPLQAASAAGDAEMVALLLAHGAQPFLSSLAGDAPCYSSAAPRGCYSAVSVAAAHGQRACLRQLLAHPLNFSARRGEREVLSLEEMLAEDAPGTPGAGAQPGGPADGAEPAFSRSQSKALQEAMYHSAESEHLDITMELRALGVAWTLHCWTHSLATAHELRIDSVIEQLLRDFLQVCPDDYSAQFAQECLPLLFNIFRCSKKEATTLLLADIFCTCFGWEPIKPIRDTSALRTGSRVDPKFINNPELSDVQFRVEGRVFYGHMVVLFFSRTFGSMLSSKLCEGNPPIVQINDIRYHIFHLVMEFLYRGSCATLQVDQSDVLELMAAANFFQLDGLLRFCEAQCSTMVDLDNVVSMYIHAKVYNAVQLLEYCQGFILQNMVSLMTYDDSAKRLLFAKKLPNHDVLTGLLLTLQARMKARRPQIAK